MDNFLPPIVDHHLVAFLDSHRIHFDKVLILNGDQHHAGRISVGFQFNNSPETVKLINDYYKNQNIPVRDFVSSLQKVKDKIMQIVRSARFGHTLRDAAH